MMRLLSLFLLIFVFAAPASAKPPGTEDWSTLPILHEGRVQPLDSFARVYLKTFSGSDSIAELHADEWLAETLFAPEEAIHRPIFKVRDHEFYELTKKKNDLYSYIDVSKAIQNKKETIDQINQTEESEWTTKQSDLITLYQNYILHTQMLRSMTLLLSLNIENTDQKNNKNYLQYKNDIETLQKKAQKTIQRKGTDLSKYNKEELSTAVLSYQLQILSKGAENNVLIRIIPDQKAHHWLSPWDTIKQKTLTEEQTKHLNHWENLASAYRNGDQESWNKHTQTLKEKNTNSKKLSIEKNYNEINFLKISGILYGISLISLVFANIFNKPLFSKISYNTLAAAVIAHTVEISLRIYILGRPPVGTLYESVIFVGLICAAIGWFLEHKQKNGNGLLLGSLSGVLLLSTATAFAGEDTMGTLVAVLNTNFWLTTHVLCITIGYGLCLITSLVAHLYLFHRGKAPYKKALLQNLQTNMKLLAILSLLFTTIGTILGGIWADQSWGRFWGWDPKENGALLIVLWLIWLLHSRISKHITEIGFAAGCAFLSAIVTLAWFGVNLLNVGLHSYGFISGIAWGIGLFCAAETLCIGSLWGIIKYKQKTTP